MAARPIIQLDCRSRKFGDVLRSSVANTRNQPVSGASVTIAVNARNLALAAISPGRARCIPAFVGEDYRGSIRSPIGSGSPPPDILGMRRKIHGGSVNKPAMSNDFVVRSPNRADSM